MTLSAIIRTIMNSGYIRQLIDNRASDYAYMTLSAIIRTIMNSGYIRQLIDNRASSVRV